MSTSVTYPSNGSAVLFAVPFPYLDKSHVKVTLDGVALAFPTDYTWETANTIRTAVAHATPAKLRIFRETPEDALTTYQTGSTLTEEELETDSLQALYRLQELNSQVERVVLIPELLPADAGQLPSPVPGWPIGWDLGGTRLANIDPTLVIPQGTAGAPFQFAVIAGATTLDVSTIPDPWAPQSLFYNGIYQDPSAWSKTGNTITFSEALPADGTVSVVAVFTGPGQINDAELVQNTALVTGAATRSQRDKNSDVLSVNDFAGANDDAKFAAAAATGKQIIVPSGSYNLTADVVGNFVLQYGVTFTGVGIPRPARRGFFKDDPGSADIWRFRDRVLIGDAVNYSGNRLAPLGGSWLTEYAANYFEKNSQAVILSAESGRYGLTVGSRCPPGGVISGIGVAAVALNEGTTTNRAFYAEAMHKSAAALGTKGMEIQGGNYTAVNYGASTYGVDGGYIGMSIGVVGGNGYLLGDAGTPQTNPTLPATCAIDIQGGDTAATWQKWNVGIVFRNGALTRDGSGNATCIAMGTGHAVEWRASVANKGATLRSDVTDVASQDVGVLFKNNAVQLIGTGETPIATFTRDATGAGGVNYIDVKSGSTAVAPMFSAIGADTNVGVTMRSKGTGPIRFMSDTSGEHFRITPQATAAVNYFDVRGGVASAPVRIAAAGADTDINIQLSPKGAGVLQFGTFTTNADAPITGYITIKDSGGITRKLAVIA